MDVLIDMKTPRDSSFESSFMLKKILEISKSILFDKKSFA